MINKTLLALFAVLVLFSTPFKLFKYGYFHPDNISFYNISVSRIQNMKLERLFVDLMGVSIFMPYIGFNKSILEYLIKRNNAKHISISFKNNNGDYLRYEFRNSDVMHRLFSRTITEANNQLSTNKSFIIKHSYKNNKECLSLSGYILKRKNHSSFEYELDMTLKGKYQFLTISSNTTEYFQKALDGITCQDIGAMRY